MRISCPHCLFEKEVPEGSIPSTAKKAVCPKCKKQFPLQGTVEARGATPASNNPTPIVEPPTMEKPPTIEETLEAGSSSCGEAPAIGLGENGGLLDSSPSGVEHFDNLSETAASEAFGRPINDGLALDTDFSDLKATGSTEGAVIESTPVDTAPGSNMEDSLLGNSVPEAPCEGPAQTLTSSIEEASSRPPARGFGAPGTSPGKTPPQGGASPTRVIPFPSKPKAFPKRHRLDFHGKGSELLKIYVLNSLLTVLTLGIYHSWGKAKVRKYLYSSTEFMGERFCYTGTGRELFNGAAKAGAIMFAVLMVPDTLSKFVHPLFGALTAPAMLVLIPFAIVSSRRFRLSRTTWHGVRFSFTGPTKDFIKLYVRGTLLNFLTLNFYSPYFHARKEQFLRSNTRYGTGAFSYTGKGGDFFRDYLKALLLTVPTLGFSWLWYRAKRECYDWDNTSFGSARFRFDATPMQYFAFRLANAFLIVATLGFAYPWAMARKIRFASEHLTFAGEVDFGKLGQTAPVAKAVGDGLAGLLDMDMGK